MASFSGEAKAEICAAVRGKTESRAFLCGVLLSSRRFTADELTVQTECPALAGMLPQLIGAVCSGLRPDTEFRTRTGRQSVWCFTLSGNEEVGRLCRALHISPENRAAAVAAQTALPAFAAGVFVACGSVTDPERGYHFEMAVPDAAFGRALQAALAAMEQPSVQLKATERRSELVLYLKQNEQIGDLLSLLGANNANFKMIDQQVYRSVRSQTNRRTNCDMANIEKTVAAGLQQIADIRRIEETIGIDALPETLREVARVRLAEPDANLRDIGAMLHPPLSRSGVHHRLRRISEIAAKTGNR
ncbi:MAG: DNA-binding protein WhiA [Oscillospiraceae bacterium]|nr:DNA-binding protein WhiA [Oscillospiraceae bacterium]